MRILTKLRTRQKIFEKANIVVEIWFGSEQFTCWYRRKILSTMIKLSLN